MNDELLKQAVEEAEQTPAAPQRQVPYGPVPMSWNISTAQTSESTVVVVQIATPEGDKVFFLAPGIAKQIGDAIIKQSSVAETGLIIPT